MLDRAMARASDFNAKHGFMVRSEGGRFCCDPNDLPRWVKELGAIPANKCLSRMPREAARRRARLLLP
jgi:hypothetical protein